MRIAVMNARRILWKTISDKFGLRFGALNQNRNSSNKLTGSLSISIKKNISLSICFVVTWKNRAGEPKIVRANPIF